VSCREVFVAMPTRWDFTLSFPCVVLQEGDEARRWAASVFGLLVDLLEELSIHERAYILTTDSSLPLERHWRSTNLYLSVYLRCGHRGVPAPVRTHWIGLDSGHCHVAALFSGCCSRSDWILRSDEYSSPSLYVYRNQLWYIVLQRRKFYFLQ